MKYMILKEPGSPMELISSITSRIRVIMLVSPPTIIGAPIGRIIGVKKNESVGIYPAR